ncbi:MAG: class I SAM-dependent methyltransferase [Candidatus Bathyarchaeia archaeon]
MESIARATLKLRGCMAWATLKLRHKIVRIIAPKVYKEIHALRMRCDIPRPMTLFLKEYAKSELVGAEIGVASGDNAMNLLQMLPIKKLYLIDPYLPYVEEDRILDFTGARKIAKKRLLKYPQVKFIEETSEKASKELTDELDFVYIDGNHSYEFVKKDIKLYSSFVKPGGVIGGHDFAYPGVTRAVMEFVTANDYKYGIDFFIKLPDWWLIIKR